MQTCHRCSAVRDGGAASAVVWVQERDQDGQVRWVCPECTRRHVRDIEARLPHGWWQ